MPSAQSYAYITYGGALSYVREAAFSIASLRKHRNREPVLVLTDRPERFPSVPGVDLVTLDRTLLHKWTGDSDYHFRIKLEGIRHLLESHVEKIIFLDTDTLVRRNIDSWFSSIGADVALLHKYEGRLGRRRFRRQYAGVLNRTFTDAQARTFEIRPASPMYNSGLVGLSRDHLPAIDAAICLMHQVNERVECHTAEQMALGHVLSHSGRIQTAGDRSVFHYWRRDRGGFIRSQLRDLLQYNSLESIMSDPALAGSVRIHRPFALWAGDKARRLRTRLRSHRPAENELAAHGIESGREPTGRTALSAIPEREMARANN